MTTQTTDATLAADELEEAWEQAGEAFRHAMRVLRRQDSLALRRFEAYVEQVFDADSRMLGMQSVDDWIGEMAKALRDADRA